MSEKVGTFQFCEFREKLSHVGCVDEWVYSYIECTKESWARERGCFVRTLMDAAGNDVDERLLSVRREGHPSLILCPREIFVGNFRYNIV